MQHQITTIKTCDIQSIQYKKPGPTVPTLVITIEVDPAADKSRKRRSSRTGGLLAMNTYPNSILFRSVPDDKYNIYDWQIAIQPLMRSNQNMESPMSPTSPQFSAFTNPFASTSSDYSLRSEVQHRASSNTYSSIGTLPQRSHSNQQSSLISPSPSLRSRRSDLSSQASSLNRPQGYQSSFPIQHPPDLPSPASTANYEDQLISGWTSAQGRSSALSSHTRGSNSVSMAGTPPAPQQTILDRAFQMRIIPGSETAHEEDASKLSSIARFEALMRETDERIKNGKGSIRGSTRASQAPDWELDEEDEDDSDDERPDTSRSEGLYLQDSDNEDDNDHMAFSVHEIPTPAQRALEYIAGRASTPVSQQRPSSNRSMVGGSTAYTSPIAPPPLPRSMTSDAATFAQNTGRAKRKSRPLSMVVPPSSAMSESTPTAVKRRSSTSISANRLSFNEFAKRLSSGSSLLLVQNNRSRSSSCSRHSTASEVSGAYAEEDEDEYGGSRAMHRGLSQSRLSGMGGGMMAPRDEYEDNTRKVGWRTSGFAGES